MAYRYDYRVEGNTVRKTRRQVRDEQRLRLLRRKAQQKRFNRVMNIAYLLFLTLSLAASGVVLSYYIKLHAEVTSTVNHISSLEKQYATMTKENDEALNRLNGNVDLEEVRRIAIAEYGMRYVEEGQIITYSDGGGNDYVRQKAEIPDGGR